MASTDKGVCVCVCVCEWTGEPLSALCANKTAALWDTGHPRSNSITLVKYYTLPSQRPAPSWWVYMSKVCARGYRRACVCPHAHMWMCDGKPANSRMCVYQRCCQWLDSPFTIHCLNQLSKCRRPHRSQSCREDIGIWEVSWLHYHRTHPDCTKWICSSAVGNSDQFLMNFGHLPFFYIKFSCLLWAPISVI